VRKHRFPLTWNRKARKGPFEKRFQEELFGEEKLVEISPLSRASQGGRNDPIAGKKDL